jgi:hypothetical protein
MPRIFGQKMVDTVPYVFFMHDRVYYNLHLSRCGGAKTLAPKRLDLALDRAFLSLTISRPISVLSKWFKLAYVSTSHGLQQFLL